MSGWASGMTGDIRMGGRASQFWDGIGYHRLEVSER
jgi:hypothetical protein